MELALDLRDDMGGVNLRLAYNTYIDLIRNVYPDIDESLLPSFQEFIIKYQTEYSKEINDD